MITQELHNEKEIVWAIASGSETAFETFVVHYGPQVERAIFQVVKSELHVKDILQDVFLNIWIAREKLPQVNDPRTWLFRIAYYRSYSWLRQQAVRTRAHHNIHASLATNEERSPVEEYSAFEETRRFIQEAIMLLPPQTKKIYTMSRVDNLTVDDIAAQLQLSPQTVKNTLSNALRSIRQHLEHKEILLPSILLVSFSLVDAALN